MIEGSARSTTKQSVKPTAIGPSTPDELYRNLHGHVARLARSLLGEKPPAELVHDVCVDATLSATRFRGDAAFSSWVYAVVARRVHKWLRTERRRRWLLREAQTRSLPATATLPDDAASARRLAGRLSDALDRLPERQRVCLLMVQLEDLPTSAVAQRLGVTPEAVRMNVHRARNRLRRWFAAGDGRR